MESLQDKFVLLMNTLGVDKIILTRVLTWRPFRVFARRFVALASSSI